MKQKLILLCLVLTTLLYATKTPVTNATIADAMTAAADGDTLLLDAGIYAAGINFQNGKVITLKSAGNGSVVLTLQVSPTGFTATDCGLIFEGLTINRGTDYFIYGDVANVKKIGFKNDTIQNVNRSLIRSANAGYSIDEISFDNCIIKNCGSNGWNLIYPKHIVKSVSVKNSTLYNYTNGESFFYPNQADATNVFIFTFENNTVYKWGKDNSRALCNIRNSYSTASTYVFKNNIITESGGTTLPNMLNATGGTLTAEKNLTVNYGTYNETNLTSSSIADLVLTDLGLTTIGFADAANADFSILSSSPVASASITGGIIGAPRWLKVITSAVALTTSVLPEGSGTVSPSSGTYNSGDNVTMTAAKVFGYQFKEWRNANTNAVVSTSNPYAFSITANTSLVAVYDVLTTYNFTVNKAGTGADWGIHSISPAPVDGKFETGTSVTVTVASNKVSNFLFWEDNSTVLSRTFTVDKDISLTATFDQIPFIVGWDFKVQTPSSGRTGDYYAEFSNSGSFSMYNADGTSAGWLASTALYNPALPGIRMWTPVANFATPRNYQATFSTVGYKNIRVQSMIGASYHAYPVITIQYSTNGTNFTELNRVDITSVYSSGWADLNGVLPDSLNGKSKVYIRWIADVTSSPLLGNAADVDGTAITNIFVYADQDVVNDVIAPVLISAIPAENSSNASANGSIVLTFNERLKAGIGSCTLGSTVLTPVFGSRTVTFAYSKLTYNTDYTFTLPAGALTDMSGNPYVGLVLNFKTMNRPQPIARLYDAVVAKDGTGNYTNIQAAIDAMPTDRTAPWLVFVKNGRFEELINIPANKPFLHLIGQDKNKVTLTYKCYSTSTRIVEDTEGYSGATGEQNNSGSVLYSQASDFYAENISFENRWGVEKLAGPQALALKTFNDKFAYYNCNMRSFQDTWQTTSTDNYRHYAYKCRIEGAVDYIYNNGNVLIEQTTLYNLRKGSVIVAPSHNTATKWGYAFLNCTIDGNAGAKEGNNTFGRPWHNAPQAVYINSKVLIPMSSEAWTNMGTIPKIFAEYNSVNANDQLLDLSGRKLTYSYTNSTTGQVVTGNVEKNVLTDVEAAQYSYENMIMGTDGWNPRAFFEPVTKPTNVTISGKILSWNSVDYSISYVVLRNDSVIGFTKDLSFEVTSGMNGTNYSYKIKAVNEYGSLGEASDAVSGVYSGFARYSILNPVISVNNKELRVSNIISGVKVNLYSVDGKLVSNDISNTNEYIKSFIRLSGIYVLKLNDESFKVKF
jgi:pectin methylesterase-like acyl-CoA thioesterase